MAYAHAGLDHRHPGVFHHAADEPRAAPGDQHVQIRRQMHQLVGAVPAGVLHQRDAVPGQSDVLQRVPHDGNKGLVGVEGLPAAPEEDGIARLQTQGGGVHRDVGPGLVDDADDAQRHPALADDEPVGTLVHFCHRADGVRQSADLPHPFHDAADAPFVQGQPILKGRTHAAVPGLGQIQRVGGEDFLLPGRKAPGDGFQGRVLLGGAGGRQDPLGILGGQALGLQCGHVNSLLLHRRGPQNAYPRPCRIRYHKWLPYSAHLQ